MMMEMQQPRRQSSSTSIMFLKTLFIYLFIYGLFDKTVTLDI
jgi:hypothetical protein